MYKFDAKNLLFFPVALKGSYVDFPDSGALIDDAEFEHFRNPPDGKELSSDADGRPTLIDTPPLTEEQLATIKRRQAATTQRQLIDEAIWVITPMKYAFDGDYIDDADKPRLIAWQKYHYALTKVDTDTEKPVWPEKPE